MSAKIIGFSRLDLLIDEIGVSGVVEMVCQRVAEGETLIEISRANGMPYSVLWRWLSADGERMAAYKSALEAKADAEAHMALDIADDATPEDVVVARLRVDTRLKLAGKWSPRQYGDQKETPGGGITVVLNRGVTAKAVGGVLEITADTEKGYQDAERAE